VLLHKVPPEYTEEARRANLQGTVFLQVTIDEEGKVGSVHVTRWATSMVRIRIDSDLKASQMAVSRARREKT
jgi:hypothetical protein